LKISTLESASDFVNDRDDFSNSRN
jgi:hypothetical protein